jgi:hypothetical protein
LAALRARSTARLRVREGALGRAFDGVEVQLEDALEAELGPCLCGCPEGVLKGVEGVLEGACEGT